MDFGSVEAVEEMAMGGFGMGGGAASIIIGLALVIFAFFSYKIYRTALILIGALGGGILGYNFVAPVIVMAMEEPAEWIPIVVAAVCAIIGIALILALQKLAIFIAGGFLGFLLGNYISVIIAASNPEFGEGAGKWVVAIVCAILVGILAGKMFRPVFIIATGLVGGLGGGLSVLGGLLGNAMIGAMVGVVIALAGIVFQFKTTTKRKDHD